LCETAFEEYSEQQARHRAILLKIQDGAAEEALEFGNEQRVGVHDDDPLKGKVFLEQREWAYRIRPRVSDRA
jgi:hypothetical protein